MPVFCTDFSVFLKNAGAQDLFLYFQDQASSDVITRGAMAWLGQHRLNTRNELLCLLHGITVLEGATENAARARFVDQLQLLERFWQARPLLTVDDDDWVLSP